MNKKEVRTKHQKEHKDYVILYRYKGEKGYSAYGKSAEIITNNTGLNSSEIYTNEKKVYIPENNTYSILTVLKAKGFNYVVYYEDEIEEVYQDASDIIYKPDYGASAIRYWREIKLKTFERMHKFEDDLDIDDKGNIIIRSGEAFDKEKDHLAIVKKDLENKYDEITSNSDYASQYETGWDYEDIANLQVKKVVSERKYGKELRNLNSLLNQPYTYRVDFEGPNGLTTLYIGTKEIISEDGELLVSSYANEFSNKILTSRKQRFSFENVNYLIKLNRQFSFLNQKLRYFIDFIDDDTRFSNTEDMDPFLIKVLQARKLTHDNLDILVSIQKNQNKIIEEPYFTNMVVQGCAGSGKSVIMLQRIFSLKEKEKNIDLEQYGMIITPNESFELQIDGIVSRLQIGDITKNTLEDYYRKVLNAYSKELNDDFVSSKYLHSEVELDQEFVNYIYSNEFKNCFIEYANSLIDERDELFESMIEELAKFKYNIDSTLTKTEKINKIKEYLRKLVASTQKYEKEKSKLNKEVENLEKENVKLLSEISKLKVDLQNESDISSKIIYAKETLKKYNDELLQKAFNLNNEKELIDDKIYELKKWGSSTLEQVKKEEKKIVLLDKETDDLYNKVDDVEILLKKSLNNASEEEINIWFEKAKIYLPELDSLSNIDREKKIKDKEEKIEKNNAQLVDCKKKLQEYFVMETCNGKYSKIYEYYDFIKNYDLTNECDDVFYKTICDYCDENNIKIPSDGYRFDLYVRLLFAREYFKNENVDFDKYKFICIDEAQDYSINEYKMIMELNPNAIYNLFGDVNQLIQNDRGINDWKQINELFNFKKFELNENYRNTNQITNYCNKVFDMHVASTGVDSDEVKFIDMYTLGEQLQDYTNTADSIAIILPRDIDKEDFIYNMKLPSRMEQALSFKYDGQRLSVMYVDEVKGDEFDRVYVIDRNMSKNERYIAYTRSLRELDIVKYEDKM